MDSPIEIDGRLYRAVPVMRGPGESPCAGCAAQWNPQDAFVNGLALCLKMPDCGPHYGRGYIFEEVREKKP